MMGPPSSAGRPRLRVLLALALVMAAQAAAMNHLIGHTAEGHNASCGICISASHAGNALPASPIQINLPKLADRPAVPVVTGRLYLTTAVVYRSRAPPVRA